ncbi:hypothetical protein NDU88_007090 [Pleurodeles waltl]|uniref:Uncharacterized protein n=1 Tax=Pleurodeles waltl TaxID=8319 RepID=A0AAV7PKT6_PLEWA|nr:hypothetical protein NDU88_007090 [Pleurodeles waltl]
MPARRWVRSGPPSYCESEELEPLRNEPLSFKCMRSNRLSFPIQRGVLIMEKQLLGFLSRRMYALRLLPISGSCPTRSAPLPLQGRYVRSSPPGVSHRLRVSVLATVTAPLATPPGGPGSGAGDLRIPIPSAAAVGTGPDGGPGSGAGDRQHPLPLRAARTRLSRLCRIQVGRSVHGVSPRGAPCRMHTARRSDPSPPRSEGEYGQGPGRPAHSNNLRLPPSRGPQPRPLQRSRRPR